jgi:hypothetical protein
VRVCKVEELSAFHGNQIPDELIVTFIVLLKGQSNTG